MTTWGGVNDFKHFLPRIFELCVTGDAELSEIEIVFGKLAYGRWEHWPSSEQECIHTFFHSLWRDLLAHSPHVLDVGDCLCGIARAVADLSPFLKEWTSEEREPAALHLADFVHSNAGMLSNKPKPLTLRNAFWEGCERQAAQGLAWLVDTERAAFLERAFFCASASDVQEKLSSAIEEHGQLRQRFLVTFESKSTE